MAVVAQRTEAVDGFLATSLQEMSRSSSSIFVASFSRMTADRCVTVHGWSGPTEDERRRFEAATATR